MSAVVAPQPSPDSSRHANRGCCTPSAPLLGSYADPCGARREIVCLSGADGTRLLVDRSCDGCAGARLLAHLAADEPAENARAVCAMYLAAARRPKCRALRAEDFEVVAGEGAPSPNGASDCGGDADEDLACTRGLFVEDGDAYRLQPRGDGRSIPQLRWRRHGPGREGGELQAVSLRVVIGALESYEPALALTRAALERHDRDPDISISVLRVEYERATTSPIVLNRGLREAVQELLARGELSVSEIAIRCGRVKRGPRRSVSGETSWLARRIGLLPEAGAGEPTPWVHTDVLALIAREGLGVSPREVEL
ncbi:MAG: hypothetical protein E6G34_11265 [Actinobacteria bacterium]|nr:MAG: hypothetical protein E6G34_11265 [Actinomycetota bacterium]